MSIEQFSRPSQKRTFFMAASEMWCPMVARASRMWSFPHPWLSVARWVNNKHPIPLEGRQHTAVIISGHGAGFDQCSPVSNGTNWSVLLPFVILMPVTIVANTSFNQVASAIPDDFASIAIAPKRSLSSPHATTLFEPHRASFFLTHKESRSRWIVLTEFKAKISKI